jgi:Inner membrane component of T3SS, cytoplasmic domain
MVADEDFCKACGSERGSSLGETKIWTPPASLGATRIFTGDGLAQTTLYSTHTMKGPRKAILGWLVVIEGKDLWNVFTLADEDGQLILGNGSGCDLNIEDTELEARHASIRLRHGKVYITDLDTSMGTLVNGEPITKSELQDGDTLKLGTTVIKFRKL